MAFASARTVTLRGPVGHVVEVQVDVAQGVVGTVLVGRPDAGITEARDRVRTAVTNAAPPWPATRRVTVLLAPANLPKSGAHLDLAIAVAIKAAALAAGVAREDPHGGQEGPIPPESLEGSVFIGELGLSGELRPVAGVLPMVLAARAAGAHRVFVPEPQAAEAALVDSIAVFGVRSLGQVLAELRGQEVPEAAPVPELLSAPVVVWRGEDRMADLDLADVEGMAEARFAAEVAAAGGHHIMFQGPRGSGKTTLAERIVTLLPDLPTGQALEVMALRSLLGTVDPSGGLPRRPPFLSPHHDASRASILGGGTGGVRPGAVSLAHHGVLLLDEFPLLRADVVDALRQPLESGEVTIARGEQTATFPARSMVVLAANPCPCGNYDALTPEPCECSEVARRRYRTKLSGPMVDRVDIWRSVAPVDPYSRDPLARPEDSATVRARVATARAVQTRRWQGRGWELNSSCPGPVLVSEFEVTAEGRRLLDEHMARGVITRRGATRVHRLAWTLSDLRGVAQPGHDEVDLALRLRLGHALPDSVLRGAA